MKKQTFLFLLVSSLGLFSALPAMEWTVVGQDFQQIAPLIFGADAKAFNDVIEELKRANEKGRTLENVLICCQSPQIREQIA